MFPLARTLFPGASLTLHVFEPRYRELTRCCLEGDGLFGVVLITRGAEVGADPNQGRSEVATLTRIVQAHPLADGRWLLETAGVSRLRVRSWLPDNPYPRALVEPWTDPPAAPEVAMRERLDAVVATYDRLLASLPVPPAGETANRLRRNMLSGGPARAAFELCAAAPVGEFDRQRLLAAAGTVERLDILAELLADFAQTFRLIEDADDSGLPPLN